MLQVFCVCIQSFSGPTNTQNTCNLISRYYFTCISLRNCTCITCKRPRESVKSVSCGASTTCFTCNMSGPGGRPPSLQAKQCQIRRRKPLTTASEMRKDRAEHTFLFVFSWPARRNTEGPVAERTAHAMMLHEGTIRPLAPRTEDSNGFSCKATRIRIRLRPATLIASAGAL